MISLRILLFWCSHVPNIPCTDQFPQLPFKVYSSVTLPHTWPKPHSSLQMANKIVCLLPVGSFCNLPLTNTTRVIFPQHKSSCVFLLLQFFHCIATQPLLKLTGLHIIWLLHHSLMEGAANSPSLMVFQPHWPSWGSLNVPASLPLIALPSLSEMYFLRPPHNSPLLYFLVSSQMLPWEQAIPDHPT